MGTKYDEAFDALNDAQRQAVTTIDGPVLVIAGPGTGKTQLISTRIGYILKNTDTLPQNILALTFTEAGVSAMRERLMQMLGQAAYDINISTYHSFGTDLLRRYSLDYEEQDIQPIDEIGSITILHEIIKKLPYNNPLKFMDTHVRDILAFISDSKRSLLLPEDVLEAASANIEFINKINKDLAPSLSEVKSISKKTVPVFEKLLNELNNYKAIQIKAVLPLSKYLTESLAQALESFAADGKTTPVTKWKNSWLAKDTEGHFIFDGMMANQKLVAAAGVYKKYQKALESRGLFDYDDMILRSINAMEKRTDFKYTQAEQYQYIMLDEFQDTNPAQMRMIELLTDHPVNEGRPNILAVGDDDQAIYAFQGADYANMAEFARHYKDVALIALKENYRSHKDILQTAAGVADQINERLHHNFAGIEKNITAANGALKKTSIDFRRFKTDAAEHEWIADKIKGLIKEGAIEASEIAVLAPKHKYLVSLLPYINRAKIPVRYERRENVLETPIIRQLEQMSRLVVALAHADNKKADALWPEVLSYDFWRLPLETIWDVSWKADSEKKPWMQVLLDNQYTKPIALFFLNLRKYTPVTTLEQQLDILIGIPETAQDLELQYISPFFNYNFGNKSRKNTAEFMALLSNLSTLRRRLHDWRRDENGPIGLGDFVEFIDAHRQAGISILDTSPYREAEDSINLMTVYGAKGREFKAVFVLSCQDDVWGNASRNQGSRLSLPANLQFIRYLGASEDERLRLLYVAVTRAKTHLYLSSYEKSLTGRPSSLLKYLSVSESQDGSLESSIMPKPYNQLKQDRSEVASIEMLEDYWGRRHMLPLKPALRTLLNARLENYQLSPTHLNKFTDVTSNGPENFFFDVILRFPKAIPPAAEFGTAMHSTIRRVLLGLQAGEPINKSSALSYFEKQLKAKSLAGDDYLQLLERGRLSLAAWLLQSELKPGTNDKFEYNFRNEASFINTVNIGGKIDWLILNEKDKTATVLDFKTGQSHTAWSGNNIKLHKYRQQLLMYKLLVENSSRFKGYRVEQGIVEFVEPNSEGEITRLTLNYDDKELEHLKRVIIGMHKLVMKLVLPDVRSYSQSVTGIKSFENYLANLD